MIFNHAVNTSTTRKQPCTCADVAVEPDPPEHRSGSVRAGRGSAQLKPDGNK